VCTKEACQFNDNLAGFSAAGVPVIGVSPDDAASHQRFRNSYGPRFPLLTDADHAVMDAWDAWGEKTSYGRTSVGVLRSTFLLDEDGRVEPAWHNVTADGHAASVLSQLQSRPAGARTSWTRPRTARPEGRWRRWASG
jgi:thioredoxin-dependent peroxiredoxin